MHYIVLDIEATDRECPEIIEIGAVKLNKHLQVIDRYQSFVQPTLEPTLNWYIKKLTGIQQNEIDTAKPFCEVLASFLTWAEEEAIFITWSNNDAYFIQKEYERHGLPYALKNHFVDIQVAVSVLLDSENPMGLKKTLEHLGYSFEGKQHRAADDALNTVRLFQHAMHTFQDIETIQQQAFPVKPKQVPVKETLEFIKCVNILHSIRFKLLKKTTEEAKQTLHRIGEAIEKIEKCTRPVKHRRKKLSKDELTASICSVQEVIEIINQAPTFNPKYTQDIALTTQKIATILQAIEKPQP